MLGWNIGHCLSSSPTLLFSQFGDDRHLEVGVSLHVVLVHVGLDLRVVGVDALVQVALLLVVGALALAEHLVDNVKCFFRDPMVMILKICISDWNLTEHIGLSRTRQQLISVRDILFAQPKVNTSWLQQGHIL